MNAVNELENCSDGHGNRDACWERQQADGICVHGREKLDRDASTDSHTMRTVP